MAKMKSKPSINIETQWKFPAVSIIIPMYNVEKYIGELLDSIYAQTFQDYELIIVDDCSTDNSRQIVESYREKFGTRLTLNKTQKNSGGPSEPSNIGINFSHGEYLLILDNDDAITPTALEELYTLAKEYDADVIACEKFYEIPDKYWNNAEIRNKIKPYSYKKTPFVTKPTLISDNLSERIMDCKKKSFIWNIWSKLIRRDFLVQSQIRFNKSMIQDMIFTCCLLFTAKKYVCVPNVVNYYRYIEDSLSHKQEMSQKDFVRYVQTLESGFNFLDKFLDEQEFFKQNPKEKYLALEIFVYEALYYLRKYYLKNPAHIFDKYLRQELNKGDNSALVAFLFNAENVHRIALIDAHLKLAQASKKIAELEAEIKRLKGEN